MRANDIEVTTAEDILKILKASPWRRAELVEGNYGTVIHAPMMDIALNNDNFLLEEIEASMERLRKACG